MKHSLTLATLLLSGMLAGAQSEDPRPIRRIPGSFTYFTADNLGNVYALTPDNQLRKYNPLGDSVGVFNDVRRYGRLTHIDATNPLKVLLYYRDYRTVVALDRLLQVVHVTDLRRSRLFQVPAIALSYDNGCWVFDEQGSRLLKLRDDGTVATESAELRLVLDEAPAPTDVFDRNGQVYLYDSARGMFVFDYYGAFRGRVAVNGLRHVQVLSDAIIGLRGARLVQCRSADLRLDETPVAPAIAEARLVRFTTPGMFVLDAGGVTLYAWPRSPTDRRPSAAGPGSAGLLHNQTCTDGDIALANHP